MQSIRKICARGVIGLGAATLLLSGVPAHADPASGAASRESQPRLLAQTKAQPGEAEQLKQQLQQEEPPKKVYDRRPPQQQEQQKKPKMRGAMPEAAPPSQTDSKPFGGGVIRKSEKPVDEE